jgi:hypothetical protein
MTSAHQEFHANRRRLEEEMRHQRQNTYRQQRDVERGGTAIEKGNEARRVEEASRQKQMRAVLAAKRYKNT